MLVRPLSIVDNTGDYARVSHSRQWFNYNTYSYQHSTGWFCRRRLHRCWSDSGSRQIIVVITSANSDDGGIMLMATLVM